MRRFLFGFMWFFIFAVVAMIVSGAFAGNAAACPENLSAQELLACSQASGEDFGNRYGSIMIFGALILAVLGTLLGVLPGTKKRAK